MAPSLETPFTPGSCPVSRPLITPGMIRWAVSGPSIGDSTDYDLNPEIRAALPPGRRLRPAAVLCPLVERETGLQLLLTRRASSLRHHGGQVAFPGGKVDPGDADPLAAALREAHEEIGLPPSAVDVIGEIDGHETVTGFAMHPFVGFVAPDFRPVPEAGEVEEVFEVPLDFLMNPANHRRGHRLWNGKPRYFYEMPWQQHYIWGATARILKGLSLRLDALKRD